MRKDTWNHISGYKTEKIKVIQYTLPYQMSMVGVMSVRYEHVTHVVEVAVVRSVPTDE